MGELLALHKAVERLTRDGVIYGVHSWGVHLTEAAYKSMFGDTGGDRMAKRVNGVEFFALREGTDG